MPGNKGRRKSEKMAEKMDGTCVRIVNQKEVINYCQANIGLVNAELELLEEIMKLENARKMRKSLDDMAALVSELEAMSSTCQFIIDHRIDLRKRLKSPNVPNAIPVKYKQQEKLVSCCQKLPAVLDFLGSVQRKEHVYHILRSVQISSHMDKNFQFAKEYCDHTKYFLSSNEEFLKKIKIATALLHQNYD